MKILIPAVLLSFLVSGCAGYISPPEPDCFRPIDFDDVWFDDTFEEHNRIDTEEKVQEFVDCERTKCEVFYYLGKKNSYEYFMSVDYDSPYSYSDPDTDEIYDFCGPMTFLTKVSSSLVSTKVSLPFTIDQEKWIRVDLSKFISINPNKTGDLTAEAAPHP